MMWKIPFYRHDLGQPELDSVAHVLAGDILTTGDTVAVVEAKLCELTGRRHALCVTSCTGAMHMALLALGVGPGDEVITTPMSFVATATAIIEAGATPVFVDVEPDTGNMDAERIEAAVTPRTKAILPVHLYGLMCDMARIREIAARHGLHVVEDAAHCVEGSRDSLRPGEASAAACFSFYATKNLTCGEGGAIVTDDTVLYERLKLLRLHGMTKMAADRHRFGYSHWDMASMGWKYNLSNIDAALLLPQFDRLYANLERRHALARRYDDALAGHPGLVLPASRPGAVHARHVYTVWIRNGMRDHVIQELTTERIGCVVNYRAIHLMTYFRETFGYEPGRFPIAERIGDETVSIPFYPTMPPEHVDAVSEALCRAVG